MPKIRIAGNLGLSFLNKLSTGYWELFDPTNGFIAFKVSALERVRLDKVDNRYFFESDLLFQSALAQITFSQLPMKSVYGDEISSLRPMKEIRQIAGKHLINFFKRLVYQYFLLDFNAGSLELLGSFAGLQQLLFCHKNFIAGFSTINMRHQVRPAVRHFIDYHPTTINSIFILRLDTATTFKAIKKRS